MNLLKTREKLRGSVFGRAALWTLSILYGAGVFLRDIGYDSGTLPIRKIKVRTVCIGNLTTGGTGKSPAVLLAAHVLHKKGVKTAILSRGFGRTSKKNEVKVLLDQHVLPWQEVGDEPWMMSRALKGTGIPIMVSSDRARSAEMALEYYAPEIILLDDGFQHRKLARDLDIVLVSALDPFGGDALLPAGNLREPVSALRRASAVVITHSDQVPSEKLAEIRDRIKQEHPQLKILEAVHKPDFLLDLKNERHWGLHHLKGKKVTSLCALGDPRPFEGHIESSGAHLTQRWRFPDHHPYSVEEIKSIESLRQGAALITTFKDFPRLPPGWQELLTGEVLALAVRMEITKGLSTWERLLTG